MIRMTGWRVLVGLCAPLALSAPVLAQTAWPERPIKLVVPFPPGGVYDQIARPLADKLKDTLGTVVIENVGGAAGARGASMVARAAPDGYTLLLAGSSMMVVIPLASKRPLYDPAADFETISRVAVVGLSFVSHPATPVSDLKTLVGYAKANPGKLSYGTPGTGTSNHLTGELFKSLAQAPGIVHVPYSGAGPALNDLIGGHIPLAVVNVTGQVLELARAGQIRLLFMTTAKRMPQAPDIPTAIESGLPGLLSESFYGLLAPAKTPREIIDRVSQAIGRSLADPGLRSVFDKASFQIETDTSAQAFRKYLADDLVRWKPIVEASGFKID